MEEPRPSGYRVTWLVSDVKVLLRMAYLLDSDSRPEHLVPSCNPLWHGPSAAFLCSAADTRTSALHLVSKCFTRGCATTFCTSSRDTSVSVAERWPDGNAGTSAQQQSRMGGSCGLVLECIWQQWRCAGVYSRA